MVEKSTTSAKHEEELGNQLLARLLNQQILPRQQEASPGRILKLQYQQDY